MTVHEDEPKPGYRIEVGTADEFIKDRRAIETLLESRGHVSPRYIRRNLPKAQVIAVGRYGPDPVAVCVLKGVNCQHNTTVSQQSGYELAPEVPELGYAATHLQHTNIGLGSRLHQEILSRTGEIVYATVRIGNVGENRILERFGFRHEGNAWRGDGDYQVGLWIRTTSKQS